MLPSFVLALREGLEAALIAGILFGALRRLNRTDLNPVAWSGLAAAALVSLVVALALNFVGAELEGPAEMAFEGLSMLFAAGLLTWMIVWMSRRARGLRQEIESELREATLARSGKAAVFGVTFVALAREGIELALFLLAAQVGSNPLETYTGAFLGLLAAVVLGITLFTSTRRMNLHRFFQVTNVILVLFAAGLVAHGVHELIELGWIPAIAENVWNINGILPEESLVGQLLKTLLGYNGNPDLSEVAAYLIYFGALTIGLRFWMRHRPEPKPNTA